MGSGEAAVFQALFASRHMSTPRAPFPHPFWRAAALTTVGLAACSSDAPQPPPDPYTYGVEADPAHCVFETPPVRAAAGPSSPAEIRAGIASTVLPMPIGTPLGGYTARLPAFGGGDPADARPKRFAKSFMPSVGVHDAPRADAIALEIGGERLVLIRVDTVLLVENDLFAVEQALAPDGSMRGRVILTSSHSHSAWAAWQRSLVLMPGIDLPRKDLGERMTAALGQVGKDALAALAPAKLGFAVDRAFDPTNIVNHDRRGENDKVIGPDGNTAGKGKDPIAWAMRIDGVDGKPIAALVDVPLHGTIGEESNQLATRDVTGGLERALTASLGYPVFHLQGAAGDVSPGGEGGRKACASATRCLDMPRLELIGAHAVPLLAPLVKGIVTSDRAVMEVVTRTFPVRRDAVLQRPDGTSLRYTKFDLDHDADGVLFDPSRKRAANPIDEFNTNVGAGLCGKDEQGIGVFSPIPGSKNAGIYASCLDLTYGRAVIFGLFKLEDTSPLPLCDTVRSTATAVRISGLASGDWLLVTAPGEPTAPYAAYLRSRSPAGPDHTLLIGFSQDHVGYLLTAEDWLEGGYEASVNLWGPLEGEWTIDGIVGAAKIAWTKEREDPEVGSSRFLGWKYPDVPAIETLVTSDHGKPAAATPTIFWPDVKDPGPIVAGAPVPRAVGAARFVWHGGDPSVDRPEVLVEREVSPGTFAPLVDARGASASSRDGLAVVTYVPEPFEAAAPTSHLYAVTWQPVPPDPFTIERPLAPFSLPLGRYRFRVKGAARDATAVTSYELLSDPFAVVAAPLAASSAATRGVTGLSIVAALGGAPGLRALRVGPSDVGIPLLGPWTLTLTFDALPARTLTATPDAKGTTSVALTTSELTTVRSVDVRDAAGNGGVLTVK